MEKPAGQHMEDKEVSGGSTGSTDAVNVQKPQRGAIMSFWKKFRTAILIALAVGILVVTLPLVLVGFPKIIQGKLDSAQVSMQGIRITQPKPNSVFMEMNSTITSSGGISATIDGFNASLYLEDKAGHVPFAYLQMPQTSADKVVKVNLSQTLDIWNQQAYTDFNTWYLLNESFRVTLDGNTYVHVKGLKATKVNFHKTVTLMGLNGFKGLNVTDVNVSLTADSLGDNMRGHATIPNPTILTVDIGNATFSNLLNNTSIGQLFIDNFVLYPGSNNVSIRANISQAPVLAAVTSSAYCKTGIVPFELVGESVIYDGQHLEYYETGFKENVQQVQLNVGAALAATLGGSLGCSS